MIARARLWFLRRRGVAAFVTAAAAIAATETFIRLVAYRVPPFHGALFAVPLMAAVFAVLFAGPRRGLPAVALVTSYAMPFYFGLTAVFPNRTDRLILGATVAVVTAGMAAGAAYLKREADRISARALAAEHERTAAVDEANRALQTRNEALARTNETLEAFTYVVSHDLKEPVRGLDVYLSAALEETDTLLLRANVLRAKEANARLGELLNGLLELSRAARHGTADAYPVWAAEVLDSPECRSRYQDLVAERGARVEVTSLQGTPPVLATTGAVAQALGNLIVNAVKHNPRTAPLVRVRVYPGDAEGTEVDTVVEDDGPGFSNEVLNRFRKRQGLVTLREGGFGLVIVQRAVESFGGRVWVGRSGDLGGAAVHVVLPSASAPSREADAPRVARSARAGDAVGRANAPRR